MKTNNSGFQSGASFTVVIATQDRGRAYNYGASQLSDVLIECLPNETSVKEIQVESSEVQMLEGVCVSKHWLC